MLDSSPSFAELLRSHRMRARLSQEQLAERAGLSASAVSALERGTRRRMYRQTLRRLVEAFCLGEVARREFEAAALDVPPRHRRGCNPRCSAESIVTAFSDVLRDYGVRTISPRATHMLFELANECRVSFSIESA